MSLFAFGLFILMFCGWICGVLLVVFCGVDLLHGFDWLLVVVWRMSLKLCFCFDCSSFTQCGVFVRCIFKCSCGSCAGLFALCGFLCSWLFLVGLGFPF